MNKLKEKIVQIINDTDITSSALFGDLVFKNCFKDYALLITDCGDFCVLCRRNNSTKTRSIILQLNFIVSILDELSNNNSIICVPHSDKPDTFPSLYFKDKTVISSIGGWEDDYNIGNSLRLTIDSENNTCSIIDSKAPILSGKMVNLSSLSERINHYLSSYIFPTVSLKHYIDKGYRTNEELGIHYSRIAVIIAVVVACLSPALSVILNNWIGRTTITENQFDVLSNKTVIVDTILHQKEPILTYDPIITNNSAPNKIVKTQQ